MALPTWVPGATERPESLRVLAALQNRLRLAASSEASAAGVQIQHVTMQAVLEKSFFMIELGGQSQGSMALKRPSTPLVSKCQHEAPRHSTESCE